MAIIIQNLTPTNPSTTSGGGVTFFVSAYDSVDPELPLTYQWQFSTDGVNYTSAGLTNNTSATYQTGPLTINQNGIFYRVVIGNGSTTVFSNEYPGIGNRTVTVFENPSIITLVDPTVDFYPSTVGKVVGQTFQLVASATLLNANITNSTLVNNISFQWQVSTNSGNTWTNISPTGNTTITTVTDIIEGTSPSAYMRYSTLTIQNISFSANLNRYRVIISYAGALNTPVTLPSVLLLIDPKINIYQQPGTGLNDTKQTNCYKTSIPNSGRITLQVAALTTAATQLTYQWQVDLGNGLWTNIEDAINSRICRLVSGTQSNTDLLRLDRFIYYDNPGFRCIVSGVSGEVSVTSDEHRVFMTDVQVAPTLATTTYNINEDRYGNIPDRSSYTADAIQSVIITASLNTARNTGINGNLRIIWERKNPGSTVWYEVGNSSTVSMTTSLITYDEFPSATDTVINDYEYITPPLRVSVDNGAKYRLKVETSAIFTLNQNSVKTLVPYYSSEITINVYRTVYILNQPADSTVFPNQSSSFATSVIPSSGSISDVSYRWQYNINNTTTGWINVPSTSPYSGVTTDLLIINPVVANPTYKWFRCVVSVTGQLSSVTTIPARLSTRQDYFISISSLNDVIAKQFENVVFNISASSLSNGVIQYQWQKSINYNTFTQSGNWTDISGATTDTLNLLSIGAGDDAFYRVRLTSFGGVVQFSNVARLFVQSVKIDLLQDIVSNIQILENQLAAYTFTCLGVSSLDTEVEYQWEIKRSGDSNFSPIGTGYNNTSDTDRTYILRQFDAIADNNAKIRCRLSAEGIPTNVYTRECTVSVIRRFTYFADVATKKVTLGSTLTLNLNPSFTGGSPSYMWQRNGVDLGETQDTLVIPNIDSSYNGSVFRCRITLDACTQHQYSRNNTVTTITVTPPSVFTVNITISITTAPSVPTYYSDETAKTGAAIGTVICIPKPDGYIEDASATDDDISRWKCAQSGTAGNTTAISTLTSGTIWNSNKPSWAASSYRSPKWLLKDDRFKGYIEMRGQYVKALDFPELARQFGTKFGGVITGTYPTYNANDYFRMPNLYAKRIMGTGNVDNNTGSVSVIPLYGPNGSSGGDKNIPGSMGGLYNYEKSAQLPPGSPGVSGQTDGTADGLLNAQTFNIGSFSTTGLDEVNAFVQPTFAGTVTYNAAPPVNAFTDTPTHNHTGVSVGWRQSAAISTNSCFGRYGQLAGGTFVGTAADTGFLAASTTTTGDAHGHGIESQGPGRFDMVRDGGMNISDSTLRLTSASRTIFDNNLRFYLRNNEAIPLNAPYFRLKYMIKAY